METTGTNRWGQIIPGQMIVVPEGERTEESLQDT